MTDAADATYIDLLVSLPELKSPFVSRQLPISSWQLEKRLGQLSPEHRQVLNLISEAVSRSAPKPPFDRVTLETDDGLPGSELEAWCEQRGLGELYHCLQSQLDRRCLLAALRRRLAGAPPPPGAYPSSCDRQVVKHWSQPHFHLQHRFTWLPAARDLLERGDSVGLERLLVQLTWDDYGRCWESCCRVGYERNLPAVIVYVLRWHLVDDWLAQSADSSAEVFDNTLADLIDKALPQTVAAAPFTPAGTSGDTQ